MAHRDMMGREIKKGDFLIFRPQGAGLRVGLVVNEDADGWEGVYTYIHRRVLVVQLDHRDPQNVNESVQKANIFGALIITGLPASVKKALHQRAKELGYE